ncbi:hypothetical protein GCM10009665_25490 [Kitasatospora nipponensis]|uniref:Uncharacterized protein n=1 Tax=Kitasatospora nipponensis TaxID=258049 RepID=A0ABN1W6R1_9ACTN
MPHLIVTKEFAARTLGKSERREWIGAPWQGPSPWSDLKTRKVDVMQRTRMRPKAHKRRPAVDAIRDGSLRRGAVVSVCGYTSPPEGVEMT